LKSILEQNSLEEFMQMAELSNKRFEGSRDAVIVDGNMVIHGTGDDAKANAHKINQFLNEENVLNPQYRPLKIPRRPKWNKEMSAEDIRAQENIAFLEWRRDIALIEENQINLSITPFEKNIEVWKQLWRVIERSDLLLQIVDARNPYFFYSADLETYIKEIDSSKEFILCVNKADYLTPELIAHWNDYFNEKGVKHIFFSALKEQEKLDAEGMEEFLAQQELEENKVEIEQQY
jgi:large subunit GTPase 1